MPALTYFRGRSLNSKSQGACNGNWKWGAMLRRWPNWRRCMNAKLLPCHTMLNYAFLIFIKIVSSKLAGYNLDWVWHGKWLNVRRWVENKFSTCSFRFSNALNIYNMVIWYIYISCVYIVYTCECISMLACVCAPACIRWFDCKL